MSSAPSPKVVVRFFEEAIVEEIAQSAPIDGGHFRYQTVAKNLTAYARGEVVSLARKTNPHFLDKGTLWEVEIVPYGSEPSPISPRHQVSLPRTFHESVHKALNGEQLTRLTLAVAFWATEQMVEDLLFQVDETRRDAMTFTAKRAALLVNESLGIETP